MRHTTPLSTFEECSKAGRYHPQRVAHQICVTWGLNQGPLTHRTHAAAHTLLTTPATSESVQGIPPTAVQHMLLPAPQLSTPSAGVYDVSSGPLCQQGNTTWLSLSPTPGSQGKVQQTATTHVHHTIMWVLLHHTSHTIKGIYKHNPVKQ